MAATIPSTEPEIIYVNEEVAWIQDLSDYPAPTYTLKYGLTKADGTGALTVTASDNGDGQHLVEIASAETATMGAGGWRWQKRVELTADGSEKTVLAQGRLEVRPDFIAGAVDARADIEAALEALTAMIRGKATKDVQSYTINGRSLQSMSPSELMEWKAALQAEALELENEERRELGLGTTQKIRARL